MWNSISNTIARAGFAGILFCVSAITSFGCSSKSNQELDRLSRQQAVTIQALNHEIDRLNEQLDQLMASRDELLQAKADVEKSLEGEMRAGDLSVSLQDKGLVVTVLDRVLFDSGKAELKPTSLPTLDKVADILNKQVSGHIIYIEGHTDDQPIRYSSWRSNWELSTARATEVLHYFIDHKTIDPTRLAATGFGEYHPAAENETSEGRLKNRRVEIVVSPKKVSSDQN